MKTSSGTAFVEGADGALAGVILGRGRWAEHGYGAAGLAEILGMVPPAGVVDEIGPWGWSLGLRGSALEPLGLFGGDDSVGEAGLTVLAVGWEVQRYTVGPGADGVAGFLRDHPEVRRRPLGSAWSASGFCVAVAEDEGRAHLATVAEALWVGGLRLHLGRPEDLGMREVGNGRGTLGLEGLMVLLS